MAVMLALACVVGEDVRLASRVEVGVVVCSVEGEVGVGASAGAEGVMLTVIIGEELAVAADSEGKMPVCGFEMEASDKQSATNATLTSTMDINRLWSPSFWAIIDPLGAPPDARDASLACVLFSRS